jgi:transposase-like protein
MLQEDLTRDSCRIGGEGVIVEIDESKFGKRKYHRGHRVEGVWVVGGVELTPQRKCFLIVVPNRSATTLHTIIEEYVIPGSIVYTDCWAGYRGIDRINNIQHRTVNHSQSFRNGEVHTNTIEGKNDFFISYIFILSL